MVGNGLCDEIQRNLLEAVAREERLQLSPDVQQHLAGCEECSSFLADIVVLKPLLRAKLQTQKTLETNHSAERSTPMFGDAFDQAKEYPIVHVQRDGSSPLVVIDPVAQPSPPPTTRRILIAASFVVVAAAIFFLLRPDSTPVELPPHAAFAEAAGKAFDEQQYEKVIEFAGKCIDGYEPAADRIQVQLEKEGQALPTGKVSDDVRDKLLSHGPLNDVAACYFYMGQAQRLLGKVDEAIKAYRAAAAYTNARVWDPRQEIFWPPADDAKYWLEKISEKE